MDMTPEEINAAFTAALNSDEPVPPRRRRRPRTVVRAEGLTLRDVRSGQEGPESLTGDGIRKQKMGVEFLVCDIINHLEQTFGIALSDWPGDTLTEHNNLVRRCWQQLGRLSMWAGGHPERTDHTEADDNRRRFIARCNRLYAEIEPGADAFAVEIWVRNQDGTTVSYADEDGSPEITRVVHTPDHEGCTEIHDGEEP